MRELASTVRDRAARTPVSRERSADLYRALAVIMVVIGHWFVISATYRDGELSGTYALRELSWIQPVTWLFQVMPIFFLVGGFVNGTSFRQSASASENTVAWILRRTDRLLRPTTALFLVLPAASLVAAAFGITTDLLGTLTWLATIPLWFLLTYLFVVVLTPWLYPVHRRFGLLVPLTLVAMVGIADLLRLGWGLPYVGNSTYLIVWLAVYHLGFCWRDGLLPHDRGPALALAAGGFAALVGLTVFGPYGIGMVGDNTNPPTLALMALATTQVGVVLALRPAVNRWLRRARPWIVVVAANSVILTVFLWHMSAAAVAAVVLYPTGVMEQPPVDSVDWIFGRFPWVAACALVLAGLVVIFAPIERRRSEPRPVASGRWQIATIVLGCAAVLAGLMWVAVAGDGDYGPTGLPVGSIAFYLTGAVLLRVARAQPIYRRRRRRGRNWSTT